MASMAEHPLPATETAAEGKGVFGWIGRLVVRRPWLVLALWIVVAAGLSQLFPPLAVLAQKAPAAILPASAPSVISAKEVTDTFKEASPDNILLVVLTNEKGLTKADEAVYKRLAEALRADTEDVLALQDFVTAPHLPPQVGDVWLMNLYRIERPHGGGEASAWSPTGIPSYHAPDSFGELVFVD